MAQKYTKRNARRFKRIAGMDCRSLLHLSGYGHGKSILARTELPEPSIAIYYRCHESISARGMNRKYA